MTEALSSHSQYIYPTLIALSSVACLVVGLLAFINVIPNIGHIGAGILMGGIPSLGLVLFCIWKSRQTPPTARNPSPRKVIVPQKVTAPSPIRFIFHTKEPELNSYVDFLAEADDNVTVGSWVWNKGPSPSVEELFPVTKNELKQAAEQGKYFRLRYTNNVYFYPSKNKDIIQNVFDDPKDTDIVLHIYSNAVNDATMQVMLKMRYGPFPGWQPNQHTPSWLLKK